MRILLQDDPASREGGSEEAGVEEVEETTTIHHHLILAIQGVSHPRVDNHSKDGNLDSGLVQLGVQPLVIWPGTGEIGNPIPFRVKEVGGSVVEVAVEVPADGADNRQAVRDLEADLAQVLAMKVPDLGQPHVDEDMSEPVKQVTFDEKTVTFLFVPLHCWDYLALHARTQSWACSRWNEVPTVLITG